MKDLVNAERGLLECEIISESENWIDCAIALLLLGEGAYRDITVLETLYSLFATEGLFSYCFISLIHILTLAGMMGKSWHKWNNQRCGVSGTSEDQSNNAVNNFLHSIT